MSLTGTKLKDLQMNQGKIKLKAALVVLFLVTLTAIGTVPMILGAGTDGGGGGGWSSATWTVDNPTTATFTGSAYTVGRGYVRYYSSGYNNDQADGHLLFTKYFTATGRRVDVNLLYEWDFYGDCTGFLVSVYISVYHGSNYVYGHMLLTRMKYMGSPPYGESADNNFEFYFGSNSGLTYTLKVRVSIGQITNQKTSAGHFCKSSSQLTSSSHWGFSHLVYQ
jgi:hypothetical protein